MEIEPCDSNGVVTHRPHSGVYDGYIATLLLGSLRRLFQRFTVGVNAKLPAVTRLRSEHTAKRLSRYFAVRDLRQKARRALPPMIFDYVDGGAEGEDSLRGNETAFNMWWLRPRPLEDVASRNQRIELFGQELSSPLILAPAGLAGLVRPYGEALAAEAASDAGIPFALSSASSCTIEDVREGAKGSLWLQVYIWRDRQATEAMIDRARNADYGALCLTVDVPLSGQRERDLRNGMTIPPRIGISNAIGVACHPLWLARMARAPVTFANVDNGHSNTMALGSYVNSQLNPSALWSDLQWIRQQWTGKLVVKGILSVDAAKRLVSEGVDGIVVSNHGGRQLNCAQPAIQALEPIADAVEGSVPLILDGGIRRGTDVVKALALGATACMVGRPYLWGLAAGGKPGVSRCIQLLHDEIDRTLALLGVANVADVRGLASSLLVPAD